MLKKGRKSSKRGRVTPHQGRPSQESARAFKAQLPTQLRTREEDRSSGRQVKRSGLILRLSGAYLAVQIGVGKKKQQKRRDQ